MTFYHANLSLKTEVSEPNFQRTRSRYRGPRESAKINQEITQFLYDIHRLYDRMRGLELDLATHIEVLTDGGEPITDLDVVGLTELTARAQLLRDRVHALEA